MADLGRPIVSFLSSLTNLYSTSVNLGVSITLAGLFSSSTLLGDYETSCILIPTPVFFSGIGTYTLSQLFFFFCLSFSSSLLIVDCFYDIALICEVFLIRRGEMVSSYGGPSC